MSVRIDIRGLPPERIAVVPSPLAELGMALHARAVPDHHPGLQSWATAVSARLDPSLADRLCEADFLWTTSHSDVFLPSAGLPGRSALPGGTLAEELDLLDRLSDEQFVDAALEFSGDPAPGRQHAPVLRDPRARQHALDLAAARGPRQLRFTQRLFADPPGVRGWLRRLLEDCDEAFFADTWARVRPQLAADARHKTELLRRKGLAGMLPAVSPALVLDETAGAITVDKLAVGRFGVGDGMLVLVPTSMGWPHLMVLHRPGWQLVLHYPVAAPGPAASGPAAPSVEQLTLRMRALAHPVRMRLCRHLARAAHTTGELADAHGMTAPEISRHLAVLKRAGLITTRRRGRYVQYRLDLGVVARLGSEFIEGVLR
ncbi:DUF5937 family protein [Streptomyces sulfonofaciens]|nr:DUF5937 family protein [Streptomyces sulfonofaciens]